MRDYLESRWADLALLSVNVKRWLGLALSKVQAQWDQLVSSVLLFLNFIIYIIERASWIYVQPFEVLWELICDLVVVTFSLDGLLELCECVAVGMPTVLIAHQTGGKGWGAAGCLAGALVLKQVRRGRIQRAQEGVPAALAGKLLWISMMALYVGVG